MLKFSLVSPNFSTSTFRNKMSRVAGKALKLFMVVATLSVGITSNARAAVLTFDDLPEHINNRGNTRDGYGNLNWHFAYLNSSLLADEIPPNPDSGYQRGTVSGDKVAWGVGEGHYSKISSSTPFNFIGAYLTGAWRNDLNITVFGLLGGVAKYSTIVTVSATSPTWFDFNYTGIDELIFDSFGGTDAGYRHPAFIDAGPQFVMDNFTYEFTSESPAKPVPEPSTILGLLAVGAVVLKIQSSNRSQG